MRHYYVPFRPIVLGGVRSHSDLRGPGTATGRSTLGEKARGPISRVDQPPLEVAIEPRIRNRPVFRSSEPESWTPSTLPLALVFRPILPAETVL